MNREGENLWINIENLSNYTRFPDLDYTIPQILEDNEIIKVCKIERFMKNEEFVKINVDWEN